MNGYCCVLYRYGKRAVLLAALGVLLNCGTLLAYTVTFPEARGMLSRDSGMASVVNSGTDVVQDGEYWLALFDDGGRYVRSSSFGVDVRPSAIVRNYQDYYENVKYALRHALPEIVLTIYDPDARNYAGDVVREVSDAYPALATGYHGSTIQFSTLGNVTTARINFNYNLPAVTVLQMRNAAAQKARQITNSIARRGMRDYELELAAHDYIVNNSAYDSENYKRGAIPPDSATDYGVLVNGRGVCQGYAVAVCRLLGMLGVPVMTITGKARNEAHAWNLVKINGEYCHLDATFDDPVSGGQTALNIIEHDYFNLPDNIIARDHRWVAADFPRAVTNRYTYYRLGYKDRDRDGNIYNRVSSQAQLTAAIASAVSARRTVLALDLADTATVSYSAGQAFDAAVMQSGNGLCIGGSFVSSNSRTFDITHLRINLKYQ